MTYSRIKLKKKLAIKAIVIFFKMLDMVSFYSHCAATSLNVGECCSRTRAEWHRGLAVVT
jgi:hypothetical protein